MRGPKPPPIELVDAERLALERLVRRHATPQQLALRAQIVLAAADGANNCQIARHLDVSVDMVRRWRTRWLVCQAASLADLPVVDRLTDAPRPGKPVRITDEQVCQIMALACEPPAQHRRAHHPIFDGLPIRPQRSLSAAPHTRRDHRRLHVSDRFTMDLVEELLSLEIVLAGRPDLALQADGVGRKV